MKLADGCPLGVAVIELLQRAQDVVLHAVPLLVDHGIRIHHAFDASSCWEQATRPRARCSVACGICAPWVNTKLTA